MFEDSYCVNLRRYKILEFLSQMESIPQRTNAIREATEDKTSWHNNYGNLLLLEGHGLVKAERQNIPVKKLHEVTVWSITSKGKQIHSLLKPRFGHLQEDNNYFTK